MWKIFRIKTAPPSIDQKVKDGINFMLFTYGKTLKDLASYDRGETFSR